MKRRERKKPVDKVAACVGDIFETVSVCCFANIKALTLLDDSNNSIRVRKNI